MNDPKLTVTLPESVWLELLHAGAQGYGDGTLFNLDKPAKYRPADWRKRSGKYWRAVNAIQLERSRHVAREKWAAELKAARLRAEVSP